MDVEVSSDGLLYKNCMHIVVVANDITGKIEAQKEVARAIIQAQEKERSIIGKELHDYVNQLLTTAKLYVQNTVYYPEQKEVCMEKSAGIIQKCINAAVRVLIKEKDHYIRVVYMDDGIGFDPACAKKGMGLTNIKSRVEVHKGKTRIQSNQNAGFKALITFPME